MLEQSWEQAKDKNVTWPNNAKYLGNHLGSQKVLILVHLLQAKKIWNPSCQLNLLAVYSDEKPPQITLQHFEAGLHNYT